MSQAKAPYIVGIAGGSGSGKTTIATKLVERLPPRSAVRLQQDAYYRHRDDLTPEQRAEINFDHPDALELDLLAQHLDQLSRSERIQEPQYDFVTHLRKTETIDVAPCPIVIVDGILLLASSAIRSRLSLKIFVDTDADLRILRRMQRDVEERGRTMEQVRHQYEATVRPMHNRFVEPSKAYADVVVPEGGKNEVALDIVLTKLQSLIRRESQIQTPPSN